MTDNESDKKKQAERTRQILDAKVEALWQLGEPKLRPKVRTTGPIPIISDVEQQVAHHAVQAIAEKYGIGKHDLYMFRRAHLMEIYHGLTRGFPLRLEHSAEMDSKINWH